MDKKETNNNFTEADFEQLFKNYFKPLVNFANKFLRNIDDSKEIVHDVFVKLWEKRDTLDSEKSIKSYIYTAVNNRCLNFIRNNKKFSDTVELENKDSNLSATQNIEELEIQAIITKTLENLSPKVRKVFMLSRYENLKYAEIAETIGISVKTVESHISKALKELRKNLREYLALIIIFLLKM